ncbi:MAG: tRNA glutamyl-Q(34) synthetase GluQRS [Bacteroidota bacterium]
MSPSGSSRLGTEADGTAVVGRFAPSPTGDLHLGSALALLAAWASVRSRDGTFIWRIEDLDGPRAVPGSAERQMEDARWLGLDWDHGPDVGGPHAPYRQSERFSRYDAALRALAEAGRLFPCRRSRKDLRALATAPHGASGLPPYPPRWRPKDLAPGWFDALGDRPDCALRFRVDDPPVTFSDRVAGTVTEDVRDSTGDVVLKRRDGVFAYQLAVVVDDLAMCVTEVVRGIDLLSSTARQILLVRVLGGRVPAYAHVPLLVGTHGDKLSKRDGAVSIREIREAGVPPEAVVGWLAWALGQAPRPVRLGAEAVAAGWEWARVRPEPVEVPVDLAEVLA